MKVFKGGLEDKTPTNKPSMWTCPVCNSATFVTLTTGAMYHKGRLVGGTDQRYCADCWFEGRKTMVAENRKS